MEYTLKEAIREAETIVNATDYGTPSALYNTRNRFKRVCECFWNVREMAKREGNDKVMKKADEHHERCWQTLQSIIKTAEMIDRNNPFVMIDKMQ